MTSWETEKETEEMAEETRDHDPIAYETDFVDNPPPAAGSIYAEIVGKLIEAGEGAGWIRVVTAGRAANSVQTGLQSAARTLGVKVKTRSRKEEGAVYVALREDDEGEEE